MSDPSDPRTDRLRANSGPESAKNRQRPHSNFNPSHQVTPTRLAVVGVLTSRGDDGTPDGTDW